MRKTRFMTVLFVVLSAAFLFVPQFHFAASVPTVVRMWVGGDNSRWLKSVLPTQAEIDGIAQRGEQARDADALAFAALHIDDTAKKQRYADEAVGMNPKLGWIYLDQALGYERNPKPVEYARKLQAFDPQNALGYLCEGDILRGKMSPSEPLENRAQKHDWIAAMDKAFAAPRYDGYILQWFDFHRHFVRSHGLDRPELMIIYMSAAPIPNLLNIRQYFDLLIRKLGPDLEKAGKPAEALKMYWSVAHFGDRMQLGGATWIEQLIGAAAQRTAYQKLEPMLRSSKQEDAAVSVSLAAQILEQRITHFRGTDILAVSSNEMWTAALVGIFLALVGFFWLLTALSVIYVNAKRWIRPEVKGRFFHLVTVSENYFAILLFIVSIGLYITVYPYQRNYEYYMTAQGTMHDGESFIMHTVPWGEAIPGHPLPIGNPFVPYCWYALAGLVVVLAIAWLTRDRTQQDVATPPKSMTAAGS